MCIRDRQKGGVTIPGATQSSLVLRPVVLTDAGSYVVIVSNSAGSISSGAAQLTVNNSTPPASQPTPSSSSSGGGGAFRQWFLQALMALTASRWLLARKK